MTQEDRLLIIGWDGADWDIINHLIEYDCLPHVASLMSKGATGVLESVVPTHSWAAWPTFLTGMDPGGHGVFDFVERDPRQPLMRTPVTSASIRANTFPEYLSNAGYEVRLGNVPVFFPPLPVKGRVISGVAVPPKAQFVHPWTWKSELDRRAPFPVNGLEWADANVDARKLLDEARELLLKRTESFKVMLEGDWKVGACIFVETDRLQHAFGAYLLPKHPDHNRLVDSSIARDLRELYRLLDEATAQLIQAAGPRATILIVSDHGFRPIDRLLNLEALLEHLGLAVSGRAAAANKAFRQSSLASRVKKSRFGHAVRRRVRTLSPVDWSRTVAYKAATGGGVSLNLKGREPHGIIEPRDYERVSAEVIEALLGYEDPESGRRPVANVLRREQVHSGPYAHLSPDLFLVSNEGWSVFGSGQKGALTSHTSLPTGQHRRAGIVIGAGENITPGDLGTRPLRDIAPTVLAYAGLRVEGLQGQPIHEIAGQIQPERTMATKDVQRASSGLSAEEENQVSVHLRDLVYIE